MSQHYSNPDREHEPTALPDVEVFYAPGKRKGRDSGYVTDENGGPLPKGWYWQSCFPGCLPDGEPNGPYDTEAEAIEAAQDID